MYKKYTFLIFTFLINLSLFSQNSVFELYFEAKYEDTAVYYEEDPIPLEYKEKPLSIESLKFYLTKFEFLLDDKLVWEEKESYHLLNLEEKESMNLTFDLPDNLKFDQIKYQLGTDSLTNIAGVMGGDLDPTKGMYWAWNSGYINFKLEGTSSYCLTRKNRFQFHLGGYQAPFETVQAVVLSVPEKREDNKMRVEIQLDNFFKKIDLKEENEIMMPSEKASDLAIEAAKLFLVKTK